MFGNPWVRFRLAEALGIKSAATSLKILVLLRQCGFSFGLLKL